MDLTIKYFLDIQDYCNEYNITSNTSQKNIAGQFSYCEHYINYQYGIVRKSISICVNIRWLNMLHVHSNTDFYVLCF